MIKGEKTCVLICIQSMWGAIEWILPAIKHLKDNHKNIIIYFMVYRIYKNEFFGSNKKLLSLTEDISCQNCFDIFYILPKFLRIAFTVNNGLKQKKFFKRWNLLIWKILKKKLSRNFINAIQPNIVLMDSAGNPFFDTIRKLGKIKIGNFLTAPSFSLSPDIWTERDILKKRIMNNKDFDFYLVDNHFSKDFYQELFPNKPVFNIGCPKFDSKWLILNKIAHGNLKDKNLHCDRNILILLKNESSAVFQYCDFSRLLHDILTVCSKIKGATIVLKPHPRQNHDELLKILRQYPEVCHIISNDMVSALAKDSQLIISMPSGIILDAILSGKPVIEYFNFPALNAFLKDSFGQVPYNIFGGIGCMLNGEITSVFRHMNLVYAADTMNQLEQYVKRVEYDSDDEALMNLRKIYPDDAAKKTAEVILAQLTEAQST